MAVYGLRHSIKSVVWVASKSNRLTSKCVESQRTVVMILCSSCTDFCLDNNWTEVRDTQLLNDTKSAVVRKFYRLQLFYFACDAQVVVYFHWTCNTNLKCLVVSNSYLEIAFSSISIKLKPNHQPVFEHAQNYKHSRHW